MIRVAVAGVHGRMGRIACEAVTAADDLELVGGLSRRAIGTLLQSELGLSRAAGTIAGDMATLTTAARPEVLVDVTLYPFSRELAHQAVDAGVSPVIGTSGWTTDDERELAQACRRRGIGAALIPNFAIGAVLMMRFAEQAARFFPTTEIVELHHATKRDAPSGTAKLTARRIASAAQRADVPIHSVRLEGLVAHQEVLFGGAGELLTIRHDSLARESFARGIIHAVRTVRNRPKLVVGLDSLLMEEPK